ncbi:MAG: amidohydrolase family protein [Rhodospirillaceae bacterium]
MRILCACITTIILLSGCNSSQNNQITVAIHNVTLLDAYQQTEKATVLLNGDTISAVRQTAHTPEGTTIIDGEGKYLIPGLWDAHVHLSYYPDLNTDYSYPLFIVNGITAVRDTGGLLDAVLPMRAEARRAGVIAPRVYVAGPLVDGKQRVYAGLNGRPNISIGIDSPEEARAQINALHAAGVDLIKLYEMNSPENFIAAAKRASELGLPITTHVPLSMDTVDAALSGINGVEHMRNLEQSCAVDYSERLSARRKALANGKNKDGGDLRSAIHMLFRPDAIAMQDSERCAEVIATLAREEVFQTPTLTINTYASSPLAAEEKWWDTYVYLPGEVQEKWLAGSRRLAERIQANAPHPSSRAFHDWAFTMVAKLRNGGVKIMAGTDNPIGFLTPGYSLHEELALLVEAGLTPMEAIISATLRPAEFMRIQDKTGTIETGKWADLVLLDADPRDDIRNTKRINTVIKAGQVFDRAELDGILAKLENRAAPTVE